jgi:hypothetical protein
MHTFFLFTPHFLHVFRDMLKMVCGHWYYFAVKTVCSKEAATALVFLCVYFVDFSLPKISCLASEMPSHFSICLEYNLYCVGFEILTAVVMKSTSF